MTARRFARSLHSCQPSASCAACERERVLADGAAYARGFAEGQRFAQGTLTMVGRLAEDAADLLCDPRVTPPEPDRARKLHRVLALLDAIEGTTRKLRQVHT